MLSGSIPAVSTSSGINGSFRNKENLQYKKTADSVLLSLFMRTNGKCNNSHAPYGWLRCTLLSVRTQYSRRTRIILTNINRCMCFESNWKMVWVLIRRILKKPVDLDLQCFPKCKMRFHQQKCYNVQIIFMFFSFFCSTDSKSAQ